MNKAIEKRKEESLTVEKFIKDRSAEFAKVLPGHLSAERMIRLALSAIRTTPHLHECSIQSVAISMMACSALGLEPNTPVGHAYLIPYRCNIAKRGEPKRYEWRCQLIVGYRGMIELFYRSGAVESVQAFPVFDGDKFEVSYGLNPDLVHVPSNDPNRWNPKKLTHTYVVVRLKDSKTPLWAVMDRQQIELHRQRSMAKNSGPWVTDYIAMALKTVVRYVSKWVPFSVEKVNAAQAIEASIEAMNPAAAIGALGPDASEASLRLLEGIPEDVEPTVEDREARTLDDVADDLTEEQAERAAIESEGE